MTHDAEEMFFPGRWSGYQPHPQTGEITKKEPECRSTPVPDLPDLVSLLLPDNPFLPGINSCLSSVSKLQFAENVAYMPLDRPQRVYQFIHDPAI